MNEVAGWVCVSFTCRPLDLLNDAVVLGRFTSLGCLNSLSTLITSAALLSDNNMRLLPLNFSRRRAPQLRKDHERFASFFRKIRVIFIIFFLFPVFFHQLLHAL